MPHPPMPQLGPPQGLTRDAADPSYELMDVPAEPATGSPIEPAPVSGRLPHLGLLRFSGPDAATFLQGQVSNDTRRLSTRAPLLAAYCTPQGRVIAVMQLIPHSSGIIAVLPRELVARVLESLRKYVLRAKVKIEDVTAQYACIGLHAPGARGTGTSGLDLSWILDAGHAYAERGGVGIARVAGDSDRYWVIGSAEDVAALPFGSLPLAAAASVSLPPDPTGASVQAQPRSGTGAERDWRLADIRAGIPQVYAATSELFVAQMLNLDLIDGISFTKGCYTGQEIIARTQHLGRIKRRMHRLRLPAGTWAIGQSLLLSDGRGGRLIEVAESAAGVEALAVLNTDASTTGAPGRPGLGAPESDGLPGEAAGATAAVEAVELSLPYRLAASGSG